MNKQELTRIIYVIKSTYPKTYEKFTPIDIAHMTEAWYAVMQDYTYEEACAGLKMFMANDTQGFPPVPGQIIEQIRKLTDRADKLPDEGEAWRLVYNAMCNSNYNAESEYEKLPAIVQRVVGSPEMLRQWAQTDLATNPLTVIQSNFMRNYRAVKDREWEDRKMPESVKALVANMVEKLKITG